MVLHENKDCRWYSFPSFDALPGVVTFVTTRNGVVHGDVYSTDNMGEYGIIPIGLSQIDRGSVAR